MQQRPIIALCVTHVIFGLCQLFAYNLYGWLALVGVWALIIVKTWIEVRTLPNKVIQTAAQTAWFIFLLAALQAGHV